jgi:hypothetical protein
MDTLGFVPGENAVVQTAFAKLLAEKPNHLGNMAIPRTDPSDDPSDALKTALPS